MLLRCLAFLLLVAPAAARAEWHEAQTPHFVVLSDDAPANVAALAADLEKFDKALRLFRGIPDDPVSPANRVTVYVVRSIKQIEHIGGAYTAGFYIPRAGGSVAFTPRRGDSDDPRSVVRSNARYDLDPITVLRHEYTHHFMFNNWEAAALPLWFTEGFAEFHATAIFQKDGSVLFGQAPGYRGGDLAYGGCTVRQIVTLSDLRKLGSCGVSGVYGYGWLLTHYFAFTEGGQAQLSAYVAAINAGQPLEKAALAAFGDLDALQGSAIRHLAQKKLPARIIYAEALRIQPPALRKLTEGEAATMEVRILSQAGVDEKEAPVVHTRAVRAAAPYPDDAGAQLVLAEAAFDAKKYAEAEQAASRALAAAPQSVNARLYLGMAQMARTAAAGSKDGATWRAIRRSFLDANRIDSDDPRPLIEYYRSFLLAGEAPTSNASDALLRAFDLAPHDRTLPYAAAYVHLRAGRAEAARAALKALAYNPHLVAIGGRNVALELLEMIDKGQAPAAIALLEPRVRDPAYEDPEDKKKRKD